MGLFLNSTSEAETSEAINPKIEDDCLSVLHKLHDQVNGPQLVQVVVQPLGRLFNPLIQSVVTSKQHKQAADNDSDSYSTNLKGQSANLNPNINSNSNPPLSLQFSSNTYLMSPDTAQALIARLDTDKDVSWLMEIIGYGLSMPFSLNGEQDSVKDCCTIYCEWLVAALLPYNEQNQDSKYQQLSKLVPVPIRSDPNKYTRKMLSHLYNVFVPRSSTSPSTPLLSHLTRDLKIQPDVISASVSRQAVLCHRVLRTIESIAHNSTNLMDDETWQHLLAFLLTINDKLLSVPTERDDIGTQLHDRILGVLFELMLLASSKSLTTPALWKTFSAMTLNWRHRPALIDHWKRITFAITKKIVDSHTFSTKKSTRETGSFSFDNLSSKSSIHASFVENVIGQMTNELLAQTWQRFLHLVGNPVELSDPKIISRTDEFYRVACNSENIVDPCQHPCLQELPQIFLNSMLSINDFISALLGSFVSTIAEETDERSSSERDSIDVNQQSGSPGINVQQFSNQINLNSLNQVSPTQPHSNQTQQNTTPTQSRRMGIKSVAMKGTKISSNNSSVSHQPSSPGLDIQDYSDSSSHSLQTSISLHKNFMQPRASITSISSRTSAILTQSQALQFKLFADRPKCNSILQVFGDWLFEASLIGSDLHSSLFPNQEGEENEPASNSSSSTVTDTNGKSYPGTTIKPVRSASISPSISSASSKSHDKSKFESTSTGGDILNDDNLSADSFEAGQAEAIGTLCRIFASKTSSEEICPAYLARFYLCLQHCLNSCIGVNNQGAFIRRQLLAKVLTNSTTLLQKDLDGINLLIPLFIKAIEFVFDCNDLPLLPPPRNTKMNQNRDQLAPTISNVELRRSSISMLLNLLAYPRHFQDLAIRTNLDDPQVTTFLSLRPKLLRLLLTALQTENDPTNMQMLFAGLSLAMHDLDWKATSNDLKGNLARVNNDENSKLFITVEESSKRSSFVYESTVGFLVKSLHLTCHLLINIWRQDTHVSLAAFELLTTVARVTAGFASETNNFKDNNNSTIDMNDEYKQATKWICDYICNQCSRPPPAHSRDMHSTIVAAYQCLSVWFDAHPNLLNDNDCVKTLMEVIELGVSGQKSRSTTINSSGVSIQNIITKGDKLMKPASMRVRDAAESLLNLCMTRSSSHLEPTKTIFSSDSSTINEMTILDKLKTLESENVVERSLEDIYKNFKYFVDEDSILFAFFNGPHRDNTTKDSAICLVRTPFGKDCWKFKFKYYCEKSRFKIIANKTLVLNKRPFSQNAAVDRHYNKSMNSKNVFINNNQVKFFSEFIENLSLDKLVDKNGPNLEEYFEHYKSSTNVSKILKQVSMQALTEKNLQVDPSMQSRRVDCEEPQSNANLEASRLIVAHLGLKSALLSCDDQMSSKFISEIMSIDALPNKICDTVHVFYVSKNKLTLKDIVESVQLRASAGFFNMLLKLGRPVIENESLSSVHWRDMCQEVSFVLSDVGIIEQIETQKIQYETSISLFWVESADDVEKVSFENLLPLTYTCKVDSSGKQQRNAQSVRYIVNPISNGLYRVSIETTSSDQLGLVLPIMNGMTLSKDLLGPMILESISNVCRRRRLYGDNYQPPHVRRRLKIQEICNRYRVSSGRNWWSR